MEIAWRSGSATVRDVADALAGDTDSAYTTVMTVMSRLAEKRLLSRHAHGRAYLYRPKITKQAYEEALSLSRVRSLISEFGEVAISQFAEELDKVDPERARKLGKMLRQRSQP